MYVYIRVAYVVSSMSYIWFVYELLWVIYHVFRARGYISVI